MPLVVLIGGSGFIGRYAAQAFAREGWRVRVATRRPNQAIDVRTYGAVGQVEPVQANIRDDASIARVVAGADVVVNLVGILAPLGKQSFKAVQEDGADRVARMAKQAGVPRLIQVSAIGADAESRAVYAQTKAAGEAAARAQYPDAIVLRPSIVFGPEDQFFNRFAGMARLSPFLPVVGPNTRFQPVYVGDVASAILAAAIREDALGKTFELGGPRIYSFAELMRLMLKVIRRRRLLLPLPFFIAHIQGFVFDLIPWVTFGLIGNGVLTRDQVRLLAKDNVAAEDAPGLKDLGVTPTTVEAVTPSYLWRFRPQGQYDETPEEA